MTSAWWPFSLSTAQQDAVDAVNAALDTSTTLLDRHAYDDALDALDHVMALHIDDLVARDGLPHHAHLINGWGDATLADGSRLVDGLASFVQYTDDGRGLIRQKHPEGEVHPWQTFAYAFMAGADPDATLGSTPYTIRSVAQSSRWLRTEEGEELGHLLYALAQLGDDAAVEPFTLIDDVEVGLAEIAASSVQAHISGHFEVCRKAHLTEGLCAAVAQFEALAPLRPLAETFLAGQLESLTLLAAITDRAADHRAGVPIETDVAQAMQMTLALGPMVENHFYWAGHVFEIAGLAMIDGFEISPRHRALMAQVANELNRHARQVLQATHFPTSFLHFGHYRRGLTLLAAAEDAAASGRPLTSDDLSTYTANFSEPMPGPAITDGSGCYEHPLFLVAEAPPGPSEMMQSMIDAYTAIADDGRELLGGFVNHRRVAPHGWPRSVHYELLEETDGRISADLHFESPAAAQLGRDFKSEVEAGLVGDHCPSLCWDDNWHRGAGRFQVSLTSQDPVEIVHAFKALIDATFPLLDERARALSTPAHPHQSLALQPA